MEMFAGDEMRRTFITAPLGVGEDLHLVSQAASHASMETKMLYDLRGEQAKMRAVERPLL